MKHTVTLIAGLILLFFSCQKGDIMTPPSPQDGDVTPPTTFDLPPEEPGGQGTAPPTEAIEYTPPTSPTINTAAPFILPGKSAATFTSNGGTSNLTIDAVNFLPAETDANFPFVPPTGSTKLWLGFIIRGYGNSFYLIRGYPIAISNGNAYWSAGAVNSQLVAGTLSQAPLKYVWIPAEYDTQTGLLKWSGHWQCSNCGPVTATTADITVSLIKINAEGLLTFKATVKIGGTTLTVDRVNFKRMTY